MKSVVQPIFSYMIGCFLLPLSFVMKLTTRFYCGGDVEGRKLHWMSQRKLSRNKKDGGLGFRFVHVFNETLLAKQWWRIMTQEDSLVARMMKARYFLNSSIWESRVNYRPNFTWSSILSRKSIIEEDCMWCACDGKTIPTMKDKWLPNLPRARILPYEGGHIHESIMVSELFS